MAVALVSLRDLAARLRVLEASPAPPAPPPLPVAVVPTAPPAIPAPEQDLAPTGTTWPDGEAPPPWCHPGPIVPLHRPGGVVAPDLWLNRLAGNLARVMAEGATARPCPSGGLDFERPCGRRVSFSAEVVREMRAAGLLPAGLDEQGRGV